MSQKFYLPEHKTQRTGVPNSNCAAASGAMLTDQQTLGIKSPSVERFRKLTEDKVGGLMMYQVADVMEESFGLTVRLYDYRDDLKWWRLLRYLKRGWFAVVAGDYDALPTNHKAIAYDGFHAVMYQAVFTQNIRVGDPLQFGWTKWPTDVSYQYVKKFDRQTQGGIHACVMVPSYVKLRSEVKSANVRAEPSNDAAIIGVMNGGQLVTGGDVQGDKVVGSTRWRKVWVPSAAKVGYVHWSVTWKLGG